MNEQEIKKALSEAASSGKYTEQDLEILADELLSQSVPEKEISVKDKIQNYITETALPAVSPYLEGAAKVLDYPGGIARTAAFAPFSEEIGFSDVLRAAMAKPLSGSQILETVGVPKGGSLSDVLPVEKGGMFDISARGAGGFGLETALDPLTYGTAGLSSILKGNLKQASKQIAKSSLIDSLSKPKQAMEGVSKKLYKSTFEKADEILKGASKKPLSDLAYEYGISGNAKEIKSQLDLLNKELFNKKMGIVDTIQKSGQAIDLNSATKSAKELLEKNKNIPRYKSDINNLLSEIDDYKTSGVGGLVDPNLAQDIKSSITSSIQESQLVKPRSDIETKFLLNVNKGISDEFAKKADNISKGLGKELKNTDESLSTIMASKKPVGVEARKPVSGVSAIDATLGGYALTSKDAGSIAGLLAKKTRDVLIRPGIKTGSAKTIKNISKYLPDDIGLLSAISDYSGIPMTAARRSLIDVLTKEQPKNYVERIDQ